MSHTVLGRTLVPGFRRLKSRGTFDVPGNRGGRRGGGREGPPGGFASPYIRDFKSKTTFIEFLTILFAKQNAETRGQLN